MVALVRECKHLTMPVPYSGSTAQFFSPSPDPPKHPTSPYSPTLHECEYLLTPTTSTSLILLLSSHLWPLCIVGLYILLVLYVLYDWMHMELYVKCDECTVWTVCTVSLNVQYDLCVQFDCCCCMNCVDCTTDLSTVWMDVSMNCVFCMIEYIIWILSTAWMKVLYELCILCH